MKLGELAAFSSLEYSSRVEKTKAAMSKRGMDVLICSDPSNINFLTGYDGTSYYVHQMVLIELENSSPLWVGRKMDVPGARLTTYLSEDNIISYDEQYIDNRALHPMEFVSAIIRERDLAHSRIGVEKDCWQFTAGAAETLLLELPDVKFVDAFGLVNDIRLIKSENEIHYMRAAAEIADLAMDAGINKIEPGIRECDVAAAISYAQFCGTKDFFGDYPAASPQLPSGSATSAPHLTWSNRKYSSDSLAYIEISGCHKRYHAPLARSIYLGDVPNWLRDLVFAVHEGMDRALESACSGNSCEFVEKTWRSVISKTRYKKDSRIGYSVGIGYPPDWGERNASFKRGDKTILEKNMCFHMIIGIWTDELGYEVSETIRVTDKGPPEVLTKYPRELISK